ncbi:hypothetical protein ACJVDH_00965 [Pedobacter sp. AW1-32]|uniref:hypothetical protein n=1 Tax=Pedobacter sp. AW1-32 TaxID=3383026 RepID=UPI003FEFF924
MKENKDTTVSKEIAEKMVQAYAEEENGVGLNPAYTKCAWFPADQIIKIAESLKENKADGLRIYFARYLSGTIEGLPQSYEGKNTLLLVQTNQLNGTSTDNLDTIENRATLCPDDCDGTGL